MVSSNTLDTVIDAVKTRYLEERGRLQAIEQRASVSLSFSGVILGIFVVYFGEIEYAGMIIFPLVLNIFFLAFVFLLLALSIYFFISCIKAKPYEQINTDPVLEQDFLENNEDWYVKVKIALSYNKAVTANKDIINQKSSNCNKGLYTLTGVVILVAIYFLLREVFNLG